MATTVNPDGTPRFYGRRKGKRLRAGRQKLMDTVLPTLRVPTPDTPNTLDPRTLFEVPPAQLWMEIGFGGGEHLAAQAAAHPDIGFVGAEPFIDGVAKLMSAIDANDLSNIRIYDEDVRRLLPGMAAGCVDRLFILFADPWPKKRHHERRLVSSENLDFLAHVLADGAELRFASDHDGYVAWALYHLRRHPAFEWTARSALDWRTRPADAIETRYEAKALARGESCAYLSFKRRPR